MYIAVSNKYTMKNIVTILIFLISFNVYCEDKPVKKERRVEKILKDKQKEVLKMRSKRIIYNIDRTRLC